MDSQGPWQRRALAALSGDFCRLNEATFVGHAFWRPNALQRSSVEILLDGGPIGLVRADQFTRELLEAGCGDGCYGFTFVADREQLTGHRIVEARLANTDFAVGAPIDLALDPIRPHQGVRVGSVEWVGGVRLVGSLRSEGKTEQGVEIFENEILVAEGRGRQWVAGRLAVPGSDALLFDVHLSSAFADGAPHLLRIRNCEGQELDGSPLTIQAFNDGLEGLVKGTPGYGEEETRAQWFDRFVPASIPFQSYDEWMRRYPRTAGPSDQPRHVCVVVIGEAEQSVERLLQQEHCDWQAVVVPSADGVTFDWSDLREALAADVADADIVVFVSAAAILRPHTVAVLTDALAVNADAMAAYGDLEVIHRDGRSMPVFFGAFDYERLLEQGYAAHCFALRPAAISIPEGESTGSLSRLFMTLFDAAAENLQKVVHSPGVLAAVAAEHIAAWAPSLRMATAAHLQRRCVRAAVDEVKGGVFPAIRIKRAFDHDALVSIVVPTRDRVDLLSACLASVRAKTEGVRYEIVIVDNDSGTPETLRYLAECEHRGDRLVPARGDFNYSRLNNLGVEAARGEFICLLNNDTEVLDGHWLEELMGRLAEPDVGAVAPMLLWPNRMVQHGGIVLGPNFAASNAFNDCMEGDAGYGDQLCVARECGAVTAACLMTRRSDYEALGGFDALAFPVLFNDVDYCLRLRAAGKRIIFTPHAKLIHREAASRAQDVSYDRSSRFRRELRQLRNRWGDALANDSAYSPLLNLDPYPFSALAWPPRNAKPRFNRPVKAV